MAAFRGWLFGKTLGSAQRAWGYWGARCRIDLAAEGVGRRRVLPDEQGDKLGAERPAPCGGIGDDPGEPAVGDAVEPGFLGRLESDLLWACRRGRGRGSGRRNGGRSRSAWYGRGGGSRWRLDAEASDVGQQRAANEGFLV